MKLHLQKLLLIGLLVMTNLAFASEELTVLSYHDVVADPGNDSNALSRSMFIAQMDYLQLNGYIPVTLKFLQKVYVGEAHLPNKAIMLTFDDGLKSYLEFVVPALKIYNYPSVASIVSGWLDGKNVPSEYENRLLTWDQLRTISNNKLVEVISHTHDLHHSILVNPQGNVRAASTARQYFKELKSYETEEIHKQRIQTDLRHSIDRLNKELNLKPMGIAWPYGLYDKIMQHEASRLGLTFQFSLNEGPTPVSDFPALNRIIVQNSNSLQPFIMDLNYQYNLSNEKRIVEFNMDAFTDTTPAQQEVILSGLLDQLETLQVNMVLLTPVAQDISRAFFPNPELRVDSDVLSWVTQQIRDRVGVRHVYLRFPQRFPTQSKLIHELARLTWFSGIVFDKQSVDTINEVKSIVRLYHPRARFGYYHRPNTPELFDFAMTRIDDVTPDHEITSLLLENKGYPIDIYVMLDDTYQDKAKLAMKLKTLKAYGAKHYGFRANNNLLVLPHKTAAQELANVMTLGAGG